MEERNMQIEEMSTVDRHLPKYYKGYDMDILITKMQNQEALTDEEHQIIGEAQDIYYELYFKEAQRKIEERRAAAKLKGIPVVKVH